MTNNDSFNFFKDLTVTVIPTFKDKSDEFFDSIFWSLLKEDKLSKDFQAFSDELNQNGQEIQNFSILLIESFAELVIEKKIDNDPAIKYLIDSKNTVFLEHKIFMENLSISIKNLERRNLKRTLIEVEGIIEEKELEIAITNLERNERKKILQDIEGFDETIVAYNKISASDNINNPQITNDWRFAIKIAAMLILVVLPIGISVFFFSKDDVNNPIQQANNQSINNRIDKDNSSNILAKTIDLSDANQINAPESNIQIISNFIKGISEGQGYASPKLTIQIELVSNLRKEKYLINKRLIINKKQKEIALLNIKDKNSAKKSLLQSDSICKALMRKIKQLEWSYNFEKDKLTLFINQNIDVNQLEIYKIKDEENTNLELFYIKINNAYYSIKINDKGSLNKVVEEVLLDKLEDI